MRFFIALIVALTALLSAVVTAPAQSEADTLRYRIEVRSAADTMKYAAPDIGTWNPEGGVPDGMPVSPAVSMTSIISPLRKQLPSRVFVILPNNTLEVWGRVNVSNGQAQNWGPFPNSYLDARTLSFPVPR